MAGIFGVALRGLGMLGKKLAKKQKTTGTEVIKSVKPNPSTRASKHKVNLAKIPGQVKRNFGMPMTRDLDKTARSFRQVTQKLKGEKVTKSGVSKGKDKK
tara:strand:- start:99 stop:398 length:300 start_codon:yes stop_codon:yes gene_type:complete